ncbi:MAG: hypothetical protein LBL86_11845 [Coriobacteriales bacterium]|nr:hypothetical protein [Coriobacteriales bacterium]
MERRRPPAPARAARALAACLLAAALALACAVAAPAAPVAAGLPAVEYDAGTASELEGHFETGRDWWEGLSPPPPAPRYAYSIGCDFGPEWLWNTQVAGRTDYAGDCTPGVLYAAAAYGTAGYASYSNTSPTVGYLRGKNPGGSTDRLGSDVVFLFGHGSYNNVVCGDYEYDGLLGTEPTGSDYMCGVRCGGDGQSADTLFNYAGLAGRDLSGTRLISFVACNTAGYLEGDDEGDHHFGDNICEAARDCDAQAVLGFTGKIHPFGDAGLYWLQKYNDALVFGYTVENACLYANEYADIYAEEHNEVAPVDLVMYAKVLGDTTVTIAPA